MAIRVEPQVFICDIDNNITDEITDFVEVVSVDWNDARQIKMAATFSIRRDRNWIYRLDPYTDYLAPYVSLYYDNGDIVTEQVGLFALDIPQKTGDVDFTMDFFQGYDLTWLLATSVLTDVYNISASARRDSSIRKLIKDTGITRTAISLSSATFTSPLSLPAGMFRLEAANYLAQTIAYYGVSADRSGFLTSSPITDSRDMVPHATYTIDDLWSQPKKRPVSTSIANVIVVTKDNPNAAPIKVTAKNNDATDPMSVFNRQTIARYFNNSDFVSATEMQKFADEMLRQGNSLYVSLDFTVAPDPTLNPHTVIDLVYNTGLDDWSGRYGVDAWKMGFTDRDVPLQLTVSRREPLFTSVPD